MARRFFFRFKTAEFVFTFLLLFSGLMLGFSSGGFVVNFQRLGFSVLSSLTKGVNIITSAIGNTVNAVGELSRLREENLSLTEKLKNYELLQRTNVDIKNENKRLKELLDFSTKIEQKSYYARIISRNSDGINTGITINKGSRNGIKKGMPVLAVQNGGFGLVGKIVTVGLETSVVMPIYDRKCYVSGRILNTRDLGLIVGNGDENSPLQMQYIKRRVLEELNYGDIIVTSGENDNYYRDIPIGTISKITVVDYDSSLNIEITPYVDFSRLETVVVTDVKELNPNYIGDES